MRHSLAYWWPPSRFSVKVCSNSYRIWRVLVYHQRFFYNCTIYHYLFHQRMVTIFPSLKCFVKRLLENTVLLYLRNLRNLTHFLFMPVSNMWKIAKWLYSVRIATCGELFSPNTSSSLLKNSNCNSYSIMYRIYLWLKTEGSWPTRRIF